MRNRVVAFVVAVATPLLAGAVGSYFTVSELQVWYASLVRPSFSPPNWLFGPVWTGLYVLMGVASYLVYARWGGSKRGKKALRVYGLQLGFNVLWSVCFFGLHSPGLALIVIALLWASIVWTMVLFNKLSRTAMYLLVPYILWVSFASVLNFSIWWLN